jgi:hypothetical protein
LQNESPLSEELEKMRNFIKATFDMNQILYWLDKNEDMERNINNHNEEEQEELLNKRVATAHGIVLKFQLIGKKGIPLIENYLKNTWEIWDILKRVQKDKPEGIASGPNLLKKVKLMKKQQMREYIQVITIFLCNLI